MKYCIPCFLLLAVACSTNEVPKNIIPPKEMKTLVFDLMKADNYVNNYVLKDTSLKSKDQHIKMYEQVFSIHKTTKKDFYNSLTYYQQHPRVNKALFDSTLAFANRQREVMYKEKHELPVDTLKKNKKGL
ncbi:MAG: DUF4296 domain-containing protein [Chitinophagaceae bacterium]|nr:DUF4296 domain-containing protein [Chitinophagaceae bacterium]